MRISDWSSDVCSSDLFSRITIAVDVASEPLEQVTKQLFKLINVVKITELDPRRAVERELLLVTVNVPADTRGQVIELVDVFEGQIGRASCRESVCQYV